MVGAGGVDRVSGNERVALGRERGEIGASRALIPVSVKVVVGRQAGGDQIFVHVVHRDGD